MSRAIKPSKPGQLVPVSTSTAYRQQRGVGVSIPSPSPVVNRARGTTVGPSAPTSFGPGPSSAFFPSSPSSTSFTPSSSPPSSVGPTAAQPGSTSFVPQFPPGTLQPQQPQPNDFEYTCSKATFAFLLNNVLRDSDLTVVDLTGAVLFDRSVGTHMIPLASGGDRISAPAREGAFVIPQGMSLIVTEFYPFAGVPNVGLPGAYSSIDPLSLIGQVTFFLIETGGRHLFNAQTTTPFGTASGVAILNESVSDGYPAITATVKQGGVIGAYQVLSPPFPGWPKIVGVRVKGFLVDNVLLGQIQNIPVCVDP